MKRLEHRIPAASRFSFGRVLILIASFCALFLFALSSSAQTPPNPVPLINQPLVPTAVEPGGPGFTLTVNGTGFVPESVVNWNASPRPTTFVSGSQLTAAIPATDIATIGSASVTVVSPAPGGGVSNPSLFLITSPIPSVTFAQTDFGTDGGAVAVATADFNGDGKADVALLRDHEVLIFLGYGDGTFQPSRSFPTGGYSGSAILAGIVAADFNKDGKIDLAVTNNHSNEDPAQGSNSVFLGNGDGAFQPAVNYPTLGFGPTAIVSADFNGDGTLDLAAVGMNAGGGAVWIFLGSGDGSFLPGAESATLAGSPYSVAAGDFSGDGVLDLAIHASYGGVSILLGNGDGTFRLGASYEGRQGYSLNASDFSGDGNFDFAVDAYYDTSVVHSVVCILGGACYELTIDTAFFDLQSADLNGDGKLDLIVSGGGFFVLVGNGDGTFRVPATHHPSGLGPVSFAAADFDNDGRVDLVAGNYYSPPLSVFMQASPVDLNPGGLHFGDQLVGTPSNSATATLTNNLTGPLTISSIALTGTNAEDFTETHDCPLSPSTLAPGATCTINVTFLHENLGEKTAAVTVSDDAPGYPQQVVNLTGAVVDPKVVLSPPEVDFGTQPLLITSPAQNVTLSNSGVGRLTIADIHTIGEDFAVTHDCVTTVAEGGHCTVSVTYTPKTLGTHSEAVAIYDNASDSPQIINLRGTSVEATVALSPASLNFGEQTILTTSSPQTLTILNAGGVPLLLTSFQLSGSFEYVSHCQLLVPIPAGESCTFDIAFRPAQIGPNTGTLTLWDNATGSPHAVSLTGIGIPSATVSVVPASVDFGDQNVGTTSAVQAVTVQNTGSDPVLISSIEVTGDFTRAHDCPISPATLLSASTCTIILSFHPPAPGTRTGTLTISDNAVGSPHTVSLSGVGIGPEVSLSVAGLDFGSQMIGTTSGPKTVTVNNSGNQPLSITNIAVSGDYAQATSTCVLPQTLAPGTACSVDITFTPTQTGDRPGALSITDNAAGSPHTVALAGKGTDFALAAATGSSTSATVTAGGTATYNLSLAPTGFAGTVSLACAGAPRAATCTTSPTSLTLDGVNPGAFTVSVRTTARAMVGPQEIGGSRPGRERRRPPLQPFVTRTPRLVGVPLQVWLMALAMLLAVAAIGVYPRRRDRRRDVPAERLVWRRPIGPSLLVATMLLLVVLWAACGGGGGGGGGNTGTPPGTYTLTVTATASGVSRSMSLTLTVN